MDQVKSILDEIHQLDHQIHLLQEQYNLELAKLPNIPQDDIPISQDPKDNLILKEWKEKSKFDFPVKNHLELNETLGLFDFAKSASITGRGWPLYCKKGAQIEWALINYMLNICQKNGFEFFLPPALVRPEILFGSGQLPKFEHQQFKIMDDEFHLYLIPTAEVSLNSLHFDETLPEEELPKKYVSYTPCFRREAGAAGSQDRGLIRMHQFNKVETFAFTTPEKSNDMQEEMLKNAEEILQGLNLHYRTALLVTGDMSFASAKTLDIEVFLPGQNRYYEVSSISNCTDFQSRRSHTRYQKKGEKPSYLHTLNGSALATSRLFVALMENNQQKDGSIILPEVLAPYLNGDTSINPGKQANAHK